MMYAGIRNSFVLSVFFAFAGAGGATMPAWADVSNGESKYITELREAADKGDSTAQYNLANSYFVGVGVVKNYAEAVRWFQHAADQDNDKAELGLGLMYYQGLGIPKDIQEALKWWHKAAEHNNPDAQDQLGFAYLLGDGVQQDNVQAYMWFNLAASHNDKHAIRDRDNLAKFMSPGDVSEAQRLQSEWVQKHS